jgi:hypothetical protein
VHGGKNASSRGWERHCPFQERVATTIDGSMGACMGLHRRPSLFLAGKSSWTGGQIKLSRRRPPSRTRRGRRMHLLLQSAKVVLSHTHPCVHSRSRLGPAAAAARRAAKRRHCGGSARGATAAAPAGGRPSSRSPSWATRRRFAASAPPPLGAAARACTWLAPAATSAAQQRAGSSALEEALLAEERGPEGAGRDSRQTSLPPAAAAAAAAVAAEGAGRGAVDAGAPAGRAAAPRPAFSMFAAAWSCFEGHMVAFLGERQGEGGDGGAEHFWLSQTRVAGLPLTAAQAQVRKGEHSPCAEAPADPPASCCYRNRSCLRYPKPVDSRARASSKCAREDRLSRPDPC